ncbi:MAG: class I SAM-dependent methyltransferase [Acidimicrobiales bacterium]
MTFHEPPNRYFSAVRHDLIANLSGSALRVLELGCGTGNTGAELLRSQIAATVVGIELDPIAARQARKVLTRVVEGNIEDIDTAEMGRFDAIIVGDVLEHLYDPWKVVAMLAQQHLKPGGQFLASIPNARCYALWLPLVVRGRFDYQETGLLDRSHIRWFTESTILSMYQAAGLAPVVVDVRRVAEARGKVANLTAQALGPFGVVQYLVRGTLSEVDAKSIAA